MKNCLAFFGMLFFGLLAALGVILVLVYADMTGVMSTIPMADEILINGESLQIPELNGREAMLDSEAVIEQTNPLEAQPLPSLVPPTPTPVPTPVPPLDPAVYRTEVLIRAKNFGTALESFMDGNQKLSENNELVNDPTWRSEMETILDQVRATGQALAEIGPPPAEYQAIDTWLDRVGGETVTLRNNYLQAVRSGEAQSFTAAGDSFTRIKEYLYQALGEMAKAGWPLE